MSDNSSVTTTVNHRNEDGEISDETFRPTFTEDDWAMLEEAAEREDKSKAEKVREWLHAGKNQLNPPAHAKTERGSSAIESAMKEVVLEIIRDADGISEDDLVNELEQKLINRSYDPGNDGSARPVRTDVLEDLMNDKIEYKPGHGYVPR